MNKYWFFVKDSRGNMIKIIVEAPNPYIATEQVRATWGRENMISECGSKVP
jgi:hypothetical protein